MIAIPEVKPVITGEGMKEVRFPSLNKPAINKMAPAIKVATKTPAKPWVAIIPIRMAAIAPVGPEIW